jgi:hypothetical protein
MEIKEEKLKLINKLINDGFKPNEFSMIEVYRNWVYAKRDEDDYETMMHIDSVIEYWEEHEKDRIERERLQLEIQTL